MNIAAERPVACRPGCASRSSTSTLRSPARRHASEAPAMPAPMTATSNSLMREFSYARMTPSSGATTKGHGDTIDEDGGARPGAPGPPPAPDPQGARADAEAAVAAQRRGAVHAVEDG